MKREKNVSFWEKNQGSFLLETLSKKKHVNGLNEATEMDNFRKKNRFWKIGVSKLLEFEDSVNLAFWMKNILFWNGMFNFGSGLIN